MPYANSGSTRIHYEVEGSGPPLVLQHGLSDSVAGLREFGYVDQLREHYRLILIDALGHGRSDKPHDPADYTLRGHVANVLAVLGDLGLGRVHYFGNSTGGWIGFGLATHTPGRLLSLTIGSAHPYADESMAIYRHIFGDGLEAWAGLIEQMAGPLPPAQRERILANDIEALRAFVAHDTADLGPVLPPPTIPCRLFAGDADPIYPLVERAAAELRNAEFFPLRGQNHMQAYVRADLAVPIIKGEVAPVAVG